MLRKTARYSVLLFLLVSASLYANGDENPIGKYWFTEGLSVYQDDVSHYYGYIDTRGTVVIEAQFVQAYAFSEGVAVVMNDDYLYGYIDKKGKWVIEPELEFAGGFYEGMAWSGSPDDQGVWKYGFINKQGDLVIEKKYTATTEFSQGLAGVQVDGLWGYIDKTGKMVIKPQFSNAYTFSKDGVAVVNYSTDENPSYGYIDKTGKPVIKTRYAVAWDFVDGLALVKINPGDDTYAFIDKTGKPKLTGYTHARSFSEGLAIVSIPNADGDPTVAFIDKTGKIVSTPGSTLSIYDYGDFKNGYAWVSIPDYEHEDGATTYGFMDKKGNIVFKGFEDLTDFNEGFAAVVKDGLIGFIDTKGNWAVEPRFAYHYPDYGGEEEYDGDGAYEEDYEYEEEPYYDEGNGPSSFILDQLIPSGESLNLILVKKDKRGWYVPAKAVLGSEFVLYRDKGEGSMPYLSSDFLPSAAMIIYRAELDETGEHISLYIMDPDTEETDVVVMSHVPEDERFILFTFPNQEPLYYTSEEFADQFERR